MKSTVGADEVSTFCCFAECSGFSNRQWHLPLGIRKYTCKYFSLAGQLVLVCSKWESLDGKMTKDQFLKAALGMEPSKVGEIINADGTFWIDVFGSAIVVTVGLISIFSLLLAVLNLHSLWTLCGTIVLFFFGPFCSFRAALHRRGR